MIYNLRDYVEKCINCGFCEAVCPTLEAADFNAFYGARGRVNLAKGYLNREFQEIEVMDSFNSCLECNACLSVCPAGISAGDISQYLKLNFIKKDPIARFIAENIIKYRDPLNIGKEAVRWSHGLEFQDESDDLLYTARMYQLMPFNSAVERLRKRFGDNLLARMSKIFEKIGFNGKVLSPFLNEKEKNSFNDALKNIYKVLRKSGIKVKYLGEDEPYSGAMLLELGMKQEFIDYENWLRDFLKKIGIKRIITIDPHTYSLLKFQIKEFIDFPFEVVFYLDLVNARVEFDGTITIHQACHLERYGEKYRKYNELLSGTRIVYPDHYNEKMLCCGGPDEVLFPQMTEKISEKRFNELKGTGSNVILTMCPICLLNLGKDSSVMDISSFIINNS